MVDRFRGFLPVVVDVETGGFDPHKHALLEVAAIVIRRNEEGRLYPATLTAAHVEPFEGSEVDPEALAVTGIKLDHPFRLAVNEQAALGKIFKPIREALKETGCNRAILVGHNAFFDLNVIKAAAERANIKRNPFHPFSTFDTVSLAGLAYGQTVLKRAVQAAGFDWSDSEAHSAIYDTEKTADLFCKIINDWELASLALAGCQSSAEE